jgi:hypothetical protein
MQIELTLLKALSTKYNYDKYIALVDKERLMQDTSLMLDDFGKYYDRYPNHKDIEYGTFYAHFAQDWHKKDLDNEDINYYRKTVIPALEKHADDDTQSVLLALESREVTQKITESLEKDLDVDFIKSTLEKYVEQHNNIYDNESDVFTPTSIDLGESDQSHGVPWFLPSLQRGLGGLTGGQFVVIAADSGVGKSCFCISQAVHTVKWIKKTESERPILYFTSEDTESDLMSRFFSNLYAGHINGGFEDIITRREEVQKSFTDNFPKDSLLAARIGGPKDMYKINRLVERYNPCLIIVDMLDCLSKSQEQGDLGLLYQQFRTIANAGYPIIGTTQSGNTSYQYFDKEKNEMVTKYREHLTDKDMANSKSSKQGATYCSIMIGKSNSGEFVRHLNTTKKKRGQAVRATVELVERFSQYKELL